MSDHKLIRKLLTDYKSSEKNADFLMSLEKKWLLLKPAQSRPCIRQIWDLRHQLHFSDPESAFHILYS